MRSWLPSVAIWATLWACLANSAVIADEHVQCHNCGQFIKVSDGGAGLRRDAEGPFCCARCLRDVFDPEDGDLDQVIQDHAFNLALWGDHRYIYFADGTLVDMGHFFAAADFAQATGGTMTWFVGWGVEWVQATSEWLNDSNYTSGHPFGGNEDLLSNSLGIFYATGVANGSVLNQSTVLDFLDAYGIISGHGPVSHSSQGKPF